MDQAEYVKTVCRNWNPPKQVQMSLWTPTDTAARLRRMSALAERRQRTLVVNMLDYGLDMYFDTTHPVQGGAGGDYAARLEEQVRELKTRLAEPNTTLDTLDEILIDGAKRKRHVLEGEGSPIQMAAQLIQRLRQIEVDIYKVVDKHYGARRIAQAHKKIHEELAVKGGA